MIYSFVVLQLFQLSCNGQSVSLKSRHTEPSTTDMANSSLAISPKPAAHPAKDIQYILQDKHSHYWFATYGAGVYYDDGKQLWQYTEKDGLNSNFVIDLKEDNVGNLWFTTSAGLCKFDGKKFTNYSDTLKKVSNISRASEPDDLFFFDNGIIYRYNGKSFSQFPIHPNTYTPSATDLDRPYGVYCMLKDKNGNLWFGTDQKGVCRFDGKTLTYFTEMGLDKAAVRTIFQDSNGNLWFGNNGYGLFRYDGKSITNFTEKNGLGNLDFINKKTALTDQPNLARVWTINEDPEGYLWIGTVDHGVWKVIDNHIKNFTTKEGLTSNKVTKIYKDQKNILWFITEGGVSKFNGKHFEPLILQ